MSGGAHGPVPSILARRFSPPLRKAVWQPVLNTERSYSTALNLAPRGLFHRRKSNGEPKVLCLKNQCLACCLSSTGREVFKRATAPPFTGCSAGPCVWTRKYAVVLARVSVGISSLSLLLEIGACTHSQIGIKKENSQSLRVQLAIAYTCGGGGQSRWTIAEWDLGM